MAEQRHAVVRVGERDLIDPYKRRLIYERDGFQCLWCGGSIDFLQLDHVVPWSAGGSDRSDNLRTLCQPCNEQRSNYVDPAEPRLVGVARACWWCARRSPRLAPDGWGDRLWVETEWVEIKAYCAVCGTTSCVPDEGWLL